jgi:hypothetical protein
MLFAAEITILGLPTTLYYALGERFNQAQIGDEVTIKLANRTEKGWIVSLLPLEQAEKKIQEQTKSKNKSNNKSTKLVSSNSGRGSRVGGAMHALQIGFWTTTQKKTPKTPEPEVCPPRSSEILKEVLDCQSVMTQKDFVFFKWMSEYLKFFCINLRQKVKILLNYNAYIIQDFENKISEISRIKI